MSLTAIAILEKLHEEFNATASQRISVWDENLTDAIAERNELKIEQYRERLSDERAALRAVNEFHASAVRRLRMAFERGERLNPAANESFLSEVLGGVR